MSRVVDINNVVWEVEVINQAWAASPSSASAMTYFNPGPSIKQQQQTFNGIGVILSWPSGGEPGLFGKLPAAQPQDAINAWARQTTSNPTAKEQTLRPRPDSSDTKDTGGILLLVLLAFLLLGGKRK